MSEFIGVKMIETVPMTAREANDKGYKIGNYSFEEDGYEVTYPNGYKSWSPAKEFEKAYLTCLTGFEVHGQADCVKPENFDLNVGSNYARIKAEDKIWEGLEFVLQWIKYELKK